MDISIIIPTFNAIGKIQACLSSIKKINTKNYKCEVIFVDDNSTDGTANFLIENLPK
jgi:glycosyltransferase involved in cell wall biosynthesis